MSELDLRSDPPIGKSQKGHKNEGILFCTSYIPIIIFIVENF